MIFMSETSFTYETCGANKLHTNTSNSREFLFHSELEFPEGTTGAGIHLAAHSSSGLYNDNICMQESYSTKHNIKTFHPLFTFHSRVSLTYLLILILNEILNTAEM